MWLWRDPADWKLAPVSCLFKGYIVTIASCLPSTFPERSSGWRSEIRLSVLWKKPRRTGVQIIRCFWVKILWAQILASSHNYRNTNIMSQCLVMVLVSPWAAFLLLFIFGPCTFNFLVKFIPSRIQHISKWWYDKNIPSSTPKQWWNKPPYHSMDSHLPS